MASTQSPFTAAATRILGIRQVQEATGCGSGLAETVLQACGGNVTSAIGVVTVLQNPAQLEILTAALDHPTPVSASVGYSALPSTSSRPWPRKPALNVGGETGSSAPHSTPASGAPRPVATGGTPRREESTREESRRLLGPQMQEPWKVTPSTRGEASSPTTLFSGGTPTVQSPDNVLPLEAVPDQGPQLISGMTPMPQQIHPPSQGAPQPARSAEAPPGAWPQPIWGHPRPARLPSPGAEQPARPPKVPTGAWPPTSWGQPLPEHLRSPGVAPPTAPAGGPPGAWPPTIRGHPPHAHPPNPGAEQPARPTETPPAVWPPTIRGHPPHAHLPNPGAEQPAGPVETPPGAWPSTSRGHPVPTHLPSPGAAQPTMPVEEPPVETPIISPKAPLRGPAPEGTQRPLSGGTVSARANVAPNTAAPSADEDIHQGNEDNADLGSATTMEQRPTESASQDGESEYESDMDSESDTPPKPEQWDFKLPVIELDEAEDSRFPDEGAAPGNFSMHKVIHGLQHGLSNARLQNYLSYYQGNAEVLESYMNTEVEDYPAIFYAVATNDEGIVRTWVNHGGDVNAVEDSYDIPLLAFSVLISEHCENDTTDVLTTLLSQGADASVIPKAFFTPYLSDLPANGPAKEALTDIDDEDKKWCKEYIRPKLAAALGLSQRYFLDKTLKTKPPSGRQRWLAERYKSSAMLGISYFLIGQPTAAASLIERLLSYMMLPKKKPLVLLFAGPSGHGKTELAKRLGDLLSLEMERVDMTEMQHETDLFGCKPPYVGSENGSPLNNFLVNNDKKKSIVFLDEFEKTGAAAATKTGAGTSIPPAYHPTVQFTNQHLRNRDKPHVVDCSKTIWILATNALDKQIKKFCEKNNREISSADDHGKVKKIVKALQKTLKPALGDHFGHPLAGRISAILPFLPFSPGEQAVVAHKFVLQLARSVRKPITLTATPSPTEHLLGNIELVTRRDASLCMALAKSEYNPDLGARSLQNAVDELVMQQLVVAFLEPDEEIGPDAPLMRFEFDVQPDGEVVAYRAKRGS
ncbi:MAG: hypothetical protein M1839_007007 [Geoglossum umbratile]|nr:MAG: hypothetical protein M1839_007007 [Geoglossum umbratile]